MPQEPVISIVDDDESVREGTVDLIKAMGFVAEAFESAEEFLQSNHLGRTSCLITDIRMPGMSGLDLCDALVRSGKAVPTILMTAFPNDIDRTRALQAGVVCYLIKPFNEQELLACLRSALAHGESESGKP